MQVILRSVLQAVGISVALLCFVGQMWLAEAHALYIQKKGADALLMYVRSEAVFPLSRYAREGAAIFYGTVRRVPPVMVLQALDHALSNDPWAPNFLWHKALQHLRQRDLQAARQAIDRLRSLGPDWIQTRNIEEVYRAVERMK